MFVPQLFRRTDGSFDDTSCSIVLGRYYIMLWSQKDAVDRKLQKQQVHCKKNMFLHK